MKLSRRRPQIKAASRVIVCDRLGRPRVQSTTCPGASCTACTRRRWRALPASAPGRPAAEHDQIAVGVSNHTNFVRPMTAGRIEVTARAIQQGRTHQLWQGDIVEEAGRLVAAGQVRLQNVEPA